VLVNQRMVSSGRTPLEVKHFRYSSGCQQGLLTRRSGSVTFWSFVASIVAHLVVLTTFGFIKFSQSEVQAGQIAVPTAKVSQVKKLIQSVPVIPKPKVKEPVKNRFIGRTDGFLPVNQIFDIPKPTLQDCPNPVKASVSAGALSLPDSHGLPKGIEFFGSSTGQRKVCYVVDCSGSMQGIFGLVQKKLRDSIGNLQPDQYFYIIFFGGDRLFESGGGYLVRATEEAKSAAIEFVDSIQPAGQTNALAAMERAVQIRDSRGVSPSVIYFLTDGFELTDEDEQRFSQQAANLLARFAPKTKINTIGFWPQSDDREMLKTISRQSGGEFIFVSDY
jgi:hypothetical protein